MNINTGSLQTAGRSTVKVMCPNCSWNNDGRLEVVDRYLTDSPPGPRGDGLSFLELYLDETHDPDDRINECPRCRDELDPTDVPERDMHALLPTAVALAGAVEHAVLIHQVLKEQVSSDTMPAAGVLGAEDWTRRAIPLLRGAHADLIKHITKETK